MSISYLNSLTPRNVVSGFVFTGVYDEILSTSQITTRVTNTFVNNSYTLLVQYSNDKVNEVNNEIYYSTNNYNNLLYFTPTSRYFKLTFTLVSGDLDNLSIETIFKSAIVYKPFVAITGTVSVDNLPAISGNVSVSNWPETSNVNITTCVPLTISSLPAISIGNSGFTSNIIASVPLTIQTLPEITIANTGFTSNIIASVPLTISSLPAISIGNSGFTSNIIASVPLTISSLPAITIGNSGFTSNIVASVPLTISSLPEITIANTSFNSNITASVPLTISSLPAITGNVAITNAFIYTKEEPTNLTFHNNAGSNVGVVLFNGPRVLRALSITNTSTAVFYVHFYNMATVPTSGDSDIWLIPIAPNVVSNILNQTDHYFNVGISYRVTTTYNNDVSPAANVCFLNGTYGY